MHNDYQLSESERFVWFFTFGVDHPLKAKIQPIRGDYDQARYKMFAIYGHHWCSQMSYAKALEQISKYGYELLPEVE